MREACFKRGVRSPSFGASLALRCNRCSRSGPCPCPRGMIQTVVTTCSQPLQSFPTAGARYTVDVQVQQMSVPKEYSKEEQCSERFRRRRGGGCGPWCVRWAGLCARGITSGTFADERKEASFGLQRRECGSECHRAGERQSEPG